MESKSTSKKIKTFSSSPDLFSLLPYEITLDCLARISKIYNPILSLVCKNFKTIISSCDLRVARSRIRKPEDQQSLYVCLNPNKKDPDPRWFALSTSIPKQQKLIPIPSYRNQKLLSRSSVLATGSEIYIIGGCLNKERSKQVLLLDCRSHQWLRLPDMHYARSHPSVAVVNGKIHVYEGWYGCEREVYDPKNKKWELQRGPTMERYSKICLVKLGNELCKIWISGGKLVWRNMLRVSGLEGLSTNKFASVAKSTTPGRVTVWWKTGKKWWKTDKRCKTKIWCAEISLERRSVQELWGYVEWSKIVFTFEGLDTNGQFFLDSAIVTH